MIYLQEENSQYKKSKRKCKNQNKEISKKLKDQV